MNYTKFLIEKTDTNEWYYTCRNDKQIYYPAWTNDALIAKHFDTREHAEEYLKHDMTITDEDKDKCIVTECEFIVKKKRRI